MHAPRPWLAATLCLALLAISAPAVQASPATDENGAVTTASWLDRIQDAFATLLPWTASEDGEGRSAPDRSTHSIHSALTGSDPAVSPAGSGDTCDPTTTEVGCTNDPDG